MRARAKSSGMGKAIRDQVVAVTGASSGVGRAIARAFGARGARVGLIARGLEGLEACAQEIQRAGGEALVLPADVSDAAAMEGAARAMVDNWGRIDTWVNNAMVSVFSPAMEMTPDEFRRETAGRWPGPIVDMLLAAWGATIGRPAFVTSTVSDVVGSPPRTFRQWVSDHADAFRGGPAS